MGVGLREEFHLACIGKLLEDIYKLRYILLALFQCGAGDGECTTELAVGIFNHAEKSFCRGYITAVGDACDYVVIGKVIVVVMVVTYVKEAVSFEAERLMNLEIKTDSFHELGLFDSYFFVFD